MASTVLVFLRTLIGKTVTELVVVDNDADLVLTNVTILDVGNNYTLVSQGGSGGLGEIMLVTQNIVAVII
ncbi:hypothetical protein [Bacillus sp. Marseille-Q3570]|uniref:hypothetical protein n=1 Tax=Bacillus sp. Marseille-Q3570 TaxID=2963522 RepID=UPI0021B77D43|nr:hypothetical protein [Bacillus sp. Marseille-Q3570]